MNRTMKIGLITTVVLAGLLTTDLAFGQTIEAGGIVIDEKQSLTVLGLGVLAGVITAYQGYRTTKEPWDTLKFFDGLIMNVIGSVILAIGAAVTQTELNVFGYVAVFAGAMGIGVQINYSRRKTVPSNAPDEKPKLIIPTGADIEMAIEASKRDPKYDWTTGNGQWARENTLAYLDHNIKFLTKELDRSEAELKKWEAITFPPGFEAAKAMFTNGIKNEIAKTKAQLEEKIRYKDEVMRRPTWLQ